MARLWSLLRPKEAERADPIVSMDDWANMFGFNGSQYPFRGGYAGGYGGKTETIENDFVSYVQGAYKANGVVFACCLARMTVFSEVRFQFQKLNDGRPGDFFSTPELDILEKPWPNGTTGELLSRAIQDVDLAGNHFVVRNDTKDGPRLRRLRPDWVEIIMSAPPDQALKSDVVAYIYRPGGNGSVESMGNWEIFPVDGSNGQVAHWSPIPDPEAQYRGMSWLTPVVREIMADKAISEHKQKFFENAATPNLAVSFKESVTPEQFEEFMRTMNETKHGVKHAYETLYVGGGADVSVVGANIQQMDFKTTTGIGETRIAAAARVHPSMVGLSEGMQGSSLNEGNYNAAKNAFGDGTMRPLWRSLCNAYDVLVTDKPDARLWYDDRDIAFLREDRLKVAQLQQAQATTISRLVMQGYTPESVVEAVLQENWSLLKHNGLYSVQLLPPGISHPTGEAGASKANNNPTGSKKQQPAAAKQPAGPRDGSGKPLPQATVFDLDPGLFTKKSGRSGINGEAETADAVEDSEEL